MNKYTNYLQLFVASGLLATFGQQGLAQGIETTTVVFQQGLNEYEGTFQMRLGAAGENDLGVDVPEGQYYLDGSPFTNVGDDKVDILRFDDIFGNGANQIPSNATILHAEIAYTTGTDGNARTGGVYHTAKLIEEVDDLFLYDDWPLDPPATRGPRSAAMLPFGSGTGEVEGQTKFTMDVTDYVQSWVDGEPNYGTVTFANDTTDGLQLSTVSNTDIEKRPSLTVTYTTENVTIREYTASRSALVRSNTETVDGSTIDAEFLDWAEGDIIESLFFFDVFADGNNRITDEMLVLGAKLILQTPGDAIADYPAYSTAADTNDAFEVAQMLVNWDTTTTFDVAGPNELNGATGPAVDIFYGMGEWSRATADVSSIVQNWKAGQENFGFNVAPANGSSNGWQILFPGTSLQELQPTLRVWTVKVPGLPSAVANADVTEGPSPLTVQLDGTQSSDSDGGALTYLWDLGNGTTSTEASLSHTFEPGIYNVLLTVTDPDGNESQSIVTITSIGAPIAVFSINDDNAPEPFRLMADASSSIDPDGGAVEITWNFGDGNTATGAVVDHVFRQGGTFNVKLTVTDDEGVSTTETKQITVWETSLEYTSFQQGMGGYEGTVEQIVRANGSIDLGQDREESYLDGRPQDANQAANDAVELIRFDGIIGNGEGQIPANAKIVRASLTYHTGTDPNSDADGPYVIGFLMEGFDENTDYETLDAGTDIPEERGPRGGVDFRYLAGYADIANQEVVTADVAPYVQRWVDGETNHGLAVFTDDTSNGWQIRTIGNANPAFRPLLEVVYTTSEVKEYSPELEMSIIAAKDENESTLDGSFLGASYLDGGGDPDYKEGLFKFEDLFGAGTGTIGDDERVLAAYLILETGGVPDADLNADSDDPYSVHQMLAPWTVESNYGTAGVSIENGEASPAFDEFLGMGENSRAIADVTKIVNNWASGEPNHGFVVKPQGGDGWQVWWGDAPLELLPRLVVYTETALPQPEPSTPDVTPFDITTVALGQNGMLNVTWESVDGASYKVETTSDFQTWNTQSDNINSQGTSTTIELPIEAVAQAFFRISSVTP